MCILDRASLPTQINDKEGHALTLDGSGGFINKSIVRGEDGAVSGSGSVESGRGPRNLRHQLLLRPSPSPDKSECRVGYYYLLTSYLGWPSRETDSSSGPLALRNVE